MHARLSEWLAIDSFSMTASRQVLSGSWLAIVAWIFLLFFAESNTITQECHTIRVNKSLSLQEALDNILQTTTGSNSANCSSIELSAGEHVLSSQTHFPTELGRLKIVGSSQQSVSVSCAYSIETNYTWYFSELMSIRIQNIHFHHCPRPLRVDTVAEVEITSSSFRSVSDNNV